MDKVFKHVQIEVGSDCITWIGAKHKTGYGALTRNKKHYKSHRYVFSNCVGPIPDGFEIHHLCHNKLCINTSHMLLVSLAEHRVITAIEKQKTHCIHGHEMSGYNVRIDKYGHRKCRACNRIKTNEWCKNNTDKRNAYNREYNKTSEKRKEWCRNNAKTKKYKEYQKQYRARRKEYECGQDSGPV